MNMHAMAELAREVMQRLQAAATPERREFVAGYLPSALRHIGVSTPHLRAVVNDVGKRLAGATSDEVLALATLLLAEKAVEAQLAAFEIIARNRTARATLDAPTLERLGASNDNWCSVDTFCNLLSGPSWRDGQLSDAHIARWAKHEGRWWRRSALVSTVPLVRGSRGDGVAEASARARTIVVCEMLVADGDDMVVKALSWALRTLISTDRVAVEAFLERHDGGVAKRVVREVRSKLDHGLKTVRTAAKKTAAKKTASKKAAAKKP